MSKGHIRLIFVVVLCVMCGCSSGIKKNIKTYFILNRSVPVLIACAMHQFQHG